MKTLEVEKKNSIIRAKDTEVEQEFIQYCKSDPVLDVISLKEFWEELTDKISDKKVIETVGEIIGTNPIFQIPAGALLIYTKYHQDQEQEQ